MNFLKRYGYYSTNVLKHKEPVHWQNSEVILLFKKGDHENLENYRPISLLPHLYKLLTKIITNRLTATNYQPVEQAGFRKEFGTTDHIQTLRLLIEKATEYNIKPHLAFNDYKTFDSLEHWAIMQSLAHARIDSRYTELLKFIYEITTIYLIKDRKTEPIKIKKDVRQGDTISPKLFTRAWEDVFKSLDWEKKGIKIDGIYLHY